MLLIGNKDMTIQKENDKRPYFPFSYLYGFLQFLYNNNNKIKIITYKDLDWKPGDNSPESYREEFLRWINTIKQGRRDPNLIYLLLQHDIDASPERAVELLNHELENEIVSNIMIFNKRINRKILEKTGVVKYTRYEIDQKYFKKLEKNHRFVIGYHSNAMERANYSKESAKEIFMDDVLELRKQYLIEYYSPHGGVPGPNGLNNIDIVPPSSLANPPRWIHNGRSPSFNGYFSDGGIDSINIDPSTRDLRDFVRRWKPGNRYRVLIHPQYYGHDVRKSPRLENTEWYESMMAMHRANEDENIWKNLTLQIYE